MGKLINLKNKVYPQNLNDIVQYSDRQNKNLKSQVLSSQKGFQGDNLPPNFRNAIQHRKATKVGPEKKGITYKSQLNICQCCSRKLEREEFKLNCNYQDLAYLGSGYPLYFYFLKFCGFILIILFLSSGLYNIITNYFFGDSCMSKNYYEDEYISQEEENQLLICEKNWITQFSIANKFNNQQHIYYQDVLNFVSLLLMICFFQYFRKKTKQIDQDCDTADISASDYTVLMKNIPVEFDAINNDYDDDIKIFIEDKLMNGEVKVINVNLAYKMQKITNYKKQKENIISKKKKEIMYIYQNKKHKNFTLKQLDFQIQDIKKQMDDLIFHFLDGKGKQFMSQFFTGWAFITLETEEQKEKILQKVQKKGIFTSNSIKYQGQKVQIDQAPDPTNVFWENLHISNQIFRQIRSILLLLLWVFFCSMIIVPVMIWQNNVSNKENQIQKLYNQQQNGGSSSEFSVQNIIEQLKNQYLAIAVSLLITFLNSISYFIIIFLTNSEKQWTRTLYNISAIKKLAFVQFMISALITFIIDLLVLSPEESKFSKIFGSGGLIYNQNFVLIMNSIIPFLNELIDIPWIYRNWERKYLVNLVDKGYPILYTQTELNNIFEEPEFDIVKRYSDCLQSMYLCAFYSPILPVGMIWSLLGIFLHYWIDKYNLLRRRVIKYNMSSDLSREMIEMLEFVLIIYCTGNLIFWIFILEDQEDKSCSIWSILGVVVGVLHAAFPMEKVSEFLCKVKNAPFNEQSYQEVELDFLTDYARENPATKKTATESFLKKIELMKEKEYQQKKQEYMQKQFQKFNEQLQYKNSNRDLQILQINNINKNIINSRKMFELMNIDPEAYSYDILNSENNYKYSDTSISQRIRPPKLYNKKKNQSQDSGQVQEQSLIDDNDDEKQKFISQNNELNLEKQNQPSTSIKQQYNQKEENNQDQLQIQINQQNINQNIQIKQRCINQEENQQKNEYVTVKLVKQNNQKFSTSPQKKYYKPLRKEIFRLKNYDPKIHKSNSINEQNTQMQINNKNSQQNNNLQIFENEDNNKNMETQENHIQQFVSVQEKEIQKIQKDKKKKKKKKKKKSKQQSNQNRDKELNNLQDINRDIQENLQTDANYVDTEQNLLQKNKQSVSQNKDQNQNTLFKLKRTKQNMFNL